MRVRHSLRYSLFGIAIFGLVCLSVTAQDKPTATPWGAAEATAEASWGEKETSSESSWGEADATAEADAWGAAEATAESSWGATDKTANSESSWDTAEATAESDAWGMAEATAEAAWDTASTGTSLTLVWQTEFTPEALLSAPGDIAIDTDGNVYATTQSSNTVKKFGPDGSFIKEWGGNGDDPGEFTLSLGIDVDSDNNVYVTDFYNRRIQKFDSDGKFLLEWPNEPSTSPAFLAIDTQGNVYIDQFPPRDEHFVEKFDNWGMLLNEWGNQDKVFGGRIEDIAVDVEGNLYVADVVMHRIQKLSPEGELLATFGGEVSQEGNGLFDDPFGISVDDSGNIYVLDSHFLQKLDWEGKFIAQWPTSGDLEKAANVAVDGEGNIYVFAKARVKAVNGNTVSVPLLKKFEQSES